MAVYIDNQRSPFFGARRGRHPMLMSHMIADTPAELHAMAARLGLRREWCQDEDTYREHYDVCASKREQAIAAGAQPITRRQLATLLNKRKQEASRA